MAPGANLSSVASKGHQIGGREKHKLANKTNTCHTFSPRREDETQEQHRNRKRRSEFESPAEKLQMFRLVLQPSVFFFILLKPTLVFSLFLPLTYKGSVNGDTSGEPSEGGQEENKETRKRGLCEEGGLK